MVPWDVYLIQAPLPTANCHANAVLLRLCLWYKTLLCIIPTGPHQKAVGVDSSMIVRNLCHLSGPLLSVSKVIIDTLKL
jgi:hypothetical protein